MEKFLSCKNLKDNSGEVQHPTFSKCSVDVNHKYCFNSSASKDRHLQRISVCPGLSSFSTESPASWETL